MAKIKRKPEKENIKKDEWRCGKRKKDGGKSKAKMAESQKVRWWKYGNRSGARNEGGKSENGKWKIAKTIQKSEGKMVEIVGVSVGKIKIMWMDISKWKIKTIRYFEFLKPKFLKETFILVSCITIMMLREGIYEM